MLRDLLSLFSRPAANKTKRKKRRNSLRTALAVESLESRMVLSASVPTLQMAPDMVAAPGLHKFNYLATFTDVLDAPFTVSNYSYTIDWGDESPIDSGTIVASAPAIDVAGTLVDGRIQAEHNYATPGEYTITVTLFEDDGVVTQAPLGTMTIDLKDMFVPDIGDANFQVLVTAPNDGIGLIDNPEGSPITAQLIVSESIINPGDVAGWTISWGDETVHISGSPETVFHTYGDFMSQFDGPHQHYINAQVHLTGEHAGTYGVSTGLYDRLVTQAPMAAISGNATVAKDATYTLNLSHDDVAADSPVVWRIIWDMDIDNDPETSDPEIENFVGDLSSVTHVFTEAGTYDIIAAVTNRGNESQVAFLTVTVGDAPIADAGDDRATFGDLPITLSGLGSTGVGLTYAWDLDGDADFDPTETGATVVFDPAGFVGSRIVKLRVTDVDGMESEVDEVTVNVLATGALVVDETLHVVGSSTGGDTVSVSLSGGNLVLNTGSGPQSFPLGDVESLNIRTGGGNDVINIAAAVTVPTTVDAGNGNDLIVGGGGRSVLMGGAGTDIVYGGAGDDVLLGGTGNDLVLGGGGNDALVGGGGVDILEGGDGRDLVVGGVGSDAILGGGGDDILIGGYTIYDDGDESDIEDIDEIMDIWSDSNSFNDRILALTAVGKLLQAGVAVFDDNAIDVITGGAGSDLVFGDRSLLQDGVIDLIALQSAQDRLITLN